MRTEKPTLRMLALPRREDPIWLKGYSVVRHAHAWCSLIAAMGGHL